MKKMNLLVIGCLSLIGCSATLSVFALTDAPTWGDVLADHFTIPPNNYQQDGSGNCSDIGGSSDQKCFSSRQTAANSDVLLISYYSVPGKYTQESAEMDVIAGTAWLAQKPTTSGTKVDSHYYFDVSQELHPFPNDVDIKYLPSSKPPTK